MHRLGFLALLLLLAACGNSGSSAPKPNFIGLLKVTVSGIGEGAVTDAKAEWVMGGVGSQSATVVPVNGVNAANDVQLTKRQVSFLDDDSAGLRYVLSRFELKNRTTTAFGNLTLYAVDVPGITLGGTAIASMFDATGVAITDTNKARAFKPTHGMHSVGRSAAVDSPSADLQFFTPLEVNNTDLANLGVKQQAINLGILTNTASVLEYGFVARNFSGGRAIAARDDTVNQDCTSDTCKGQITLAYVLPKISPRQSNPFSFSLYFVVANETTSSVSQSLEEQSLAQAAGLTSFTGFGRVRNLAGAGSGLTGEDKVLPLCRARFAVSPDLFLGPSSISTTAGSLDICFGVNGKRTTAFNSINNPDVAKAIALQSDSKIVVAGYTLVSGNYDFALARYNPDGALDTAFDGDGKVNTSIFTSTSMDLSFAVAIQSDGKIVAAGRTFNGSNDDFALARYNPNGSLDNTFGSFGKVRTPIGSSTDQINAIAIQPDGKIVVGGYSDNGSNTDFALARYNTNGSLDTTFDTDGKVTTPVGSSADSINAVAIQTDGKIVAAGASHNGSNDDFALVRYNSDGSLDTAFDGDGKVITPIGSSSDQINALTLQTDGKIVAAGYFFSGSSYDFALARYNSDGSLDTTFDTDGKVTTDFGSSADIANAIAVQPDGKIIVGGNSSNAFSLARYNTSSSLDTTFDGDGKVTTAIGSSADSINAVAIQTDGKLVAAGYTLNATEDFALARYNP